MNFTSKSYSKSASSDSFLTRRKFRERIRKQAFSTRIYGCHNSIKSPMFSRRFSGFRAAAAVDLSVAAAVIRRPQQSSALRLPLHSFTYQTQFTAKSYHLRKKKKHKSTAAVTGGEKQLKKQTEAGAERRSLKATAAVVSGKQKREEVVV